MAGGWRPWLRAPRARLLALRYFCERGNASPPPGGVLERLFYFPHAAPVDRKRRTRAARRATSIARTALPKGVFWLVLEFWRSDRDRPDPRARAWGPAAARALPTVHAG